MNSLDKAGTFRLGTRHVKRLGYGAMQFAGPGVFGPPKDRAAAVAVLRAAVESGVDHIDTSDFYGQHVTRVVNQDPGQVRPCRLPLIARGAPCASTLLMLLEAIIDSTHDGSNLAATLLVRDIDDSLVAALKGRVGAASPRCWPACQTSATIAMQHPHSPDRKPG